MNPSLYQRVVRISQEFEGGTFNLSPGATSIRVEHEAGYYVSLPDGKKCEILDPIVIGQFVYKNNLEDSFYYLGTWFDGKVWHIDRTVWFSDQELALQEASKYDQVAIWDCENKQEILVEVPVTIS